MKQDTRSRHVLTRPLHMVAQLCSEIERKYGDKETLTIEENAVIKQWFGFSSFTEAERVSKAIGEALHLAQSMGFQSDKTEFSGNINKVRERLFTPEGLMRLPSDEQIIHIKDIGFIHARKIRQNEIAPYCDDLADNPLEGGRLTSDPKIDLRQDQACQPHPAISCLGASRTRTGHHASTHAHRRIRETCT